MSEFRGTKGDWVLRENKSTIMSEEQCLIARVFDGKGTALLADKNQSDTIVEANALLISKAPEMLDMLKKHLGILYDIQMEDSGDNIYVKNLIFETKQLIKQATDL